MSTQEDGEEFWLVWSPTGPKSPQHRHFNDVAARAEAERLARQHPGQLFYVLHATEYCLVNDMRHVVLAKRDIPF